MGASPVWSNALEVNGQMKPCVTLSLRLFAIIVCWALLAGRSAVAEYAPAQLSKALADRLIQSPANDVHTCWVYVTSDALAVEAVPLSSRSLSRRSRADATGLLIDDTDRPIRAGIVDSVRNTGVDIIYVSRWLHAIALRATADQLDELLQRQFVDRIDIARTWLSPNLPPSVPSRPTEQPSRSTALDYGRAQFQAEFINATRLHDAGITGRGVLIAILDTGFEIDHPALDSIDIVAARNFIDSTQPIDGPDCPNEPPGFHQNGHGTLTLSVMAANVPGELVGVAPHASFLLAKTEITCGGTEIKAEEFNWIAAAEWADSAGADIITASLGYTEFTDGGSYSISDLDGDTPLITRAADIAASKNILVVTSAGNSRNRPWGTISTPADGDSVLAVGAVDASGTLASFSSPGPTADGRIKPDIVSLGVGVQTASFLGGYTTADGTSLSAPLVAGGAALAFQADSSLTAMVLFEMIRSTGSRAGSPDNDFGYGIYDAFASANVVRIVEPKVVQVELGGTVLATVSTTGSVVPVLGLIAPPDGLTLQDNLDGSGVLEVSGLESNPVRTSFRLTADIGFLSDTVVVELHTIGPAGDEITAGPNPFSDSVLFFVRPSLGKLLSVSVFNISGELVWEKVNNLPISTDVRIDAWHGRNLRGEPVSAGVYIARVQTDRRQVMLKLLKTD